MRLNRSFALAVLSLAVLAAAPSWAKGKAAARCPKGQTRAGGKCVVACPTEGRLAEPDACECPAGYGKILLGSGGGQCDRLRCPSGAEMPADRDCDCAAGYEKHQAGKGKVRCEARAAQQQ